MADGARLTRWIGADDALEAKRLEVVVRVAVAVRRAWCVSISMSRRGSRIRKF
jgi:hypothetical protein